MEGYMGIGLDDAAKMRDILHNLDLSNPEHKKLYDELAFKFISCFEVSPKGPDLVAYNDGKENITVGYGFNMSDPAAKTLWGKAFAGINDAPSFDDVMAGKAQITAEEALKLYHGVRAVKRGELSVLYEPHWDKFKPNEQLMIEDLYYNSGNRIVGRKTSVRAHMMDYGDTKDPASLKSAVEVVKNANKEPDKIRAGIQKRRDAQAELGDSAKCPFYTKPGEQVKHEETIVKPNSDITIPRKSGDLEEGCTKSDRYYIWRTQLDHKVRKAHMLREGKIFDSQNPPDDGNPHEKNNCRCTADYFIPNWIVIMIQEEKQILRKYLTTADLVNFVTKVYPIHIE
jgi:hypothetical protein